jgi:chromosome segregation ATPase
VITQQREYITQLEKDITESPELALFKQKYNSSSVKIKDLTNSLTLCSDDNKKLVQAMGAMKIALDNLKIECQEKDKELEELRREKDEAILGMESEQSKSEALSELTVSNSNYTSHSVTPTPQKIYEEEHNRSFPSLVDQLQEQWETERQKNEELEKRIIELESTLAVNGKSVETHPQYQLQLDYNEKLETKFIELSNERAELIDQLYSERKRNEMLIEQVEEIPRFITAYQEERRKLKEKDIQRDKLISELEAFQRSLKDQVISLGGYVNTQSVKELEEKSIEIKSKVLPEIEKQSVDFVGICGHCSDQHYDI